MSAKTTCASGAQSLLARPHDERPRRRAVSRGGRVQRRAPGSAGGLASTILTGEDTSWKLPGLVPGRGAVVDGTDRVDRVRLVGALVRAVAQHAGKAQRDAARVARAALHPVEGDLDHQL